MGILFNLQKKALLRKLQKATIKSKKLNETRKLEAKQERELNKLKNEITKKSKIRLSKADKLTLKGKSTKRKANIKKAKDTAKFIGKTGLDFATKLGKYLDKNIATKSPTGKRKKSRRRKSLY